MATESEIALGAAETATAKASEASASASSASTSAQTATSKASEASTSAAGAATSATTASQKATEIANLVASITTSQGICETKADASATSAEQASQSAALAGSRATSAGTYATSANQSATVATAKASEAAASAASAIQNFNTLDAAKVDKVAGKGLSTNDYTTAEKTKLSGIATGATANDTDANLKSRANHTGTQTASTISDFVETVRATVLTGLSTATNAVISTTDTVLGALGKLQKQITDHLANTSNPHSVTKAQVGLGSVPNTDATNPANISQSAIYRFVSDTEKTAWNAKESAITAGTTSQYYRGDKSFQTLDKSAVGLVNVDNTSDLNKPVSTAQQTALNAKANLSGSDFTGAISAQTTISAGLPTLGFIRLSAGGATSSGYFEIYKASNVRLAYIGYDNNNVDFNAENSANFRFKGGKLSVGTDTPSGIFDASSTTLPSYPLPRMTTTQVNALTGMTAGAMIFDITTGHPKYYSGSAWVQL